MEESKNMDLAAVVLAAGEGKRMKSNFPKILHPILGIPMINYIITAISQLNPYKIVVVVGNGEDTVKKELEPHGIEFVRQAEQLGTGHAVKCSKSELVEFNGNILIINGDFPLITSRTLLSLLKNHNKSESSLSFLTTELEDPSGYGRVRRNGHDNILDIIEDRDCTGTQKKIKEINSGTYLVASNALWKLVDQLTNDNTQQEFYLPDIVKIAQINNYKVSSYKSLNSEELLGVNDRYQLSVAESIMKTRINNKWMKNGVSIINPVTTYISPTASLGKDTTIFPNTYIMGITKIGKNSCIGPSTWIQDCNIGRNVNIRMNCFLEKSKVSDNVQIGPFAHIRPGTLISSNSKIGNFVEVKNSSIGHNTKVPHLSYIGDALLGKNVNIGAGSITCNYDGFSKHTTIIEDGVFVGSDTMLVAPLKVGKNSTIGAGSTITKDVKENTLAISRAKQTTIENWKRKPK